MISAEDVIKIMKLSPLPGEGGFYRETYRNVVKTENGSEFISASAIYYMVTPANFSALHRLKHDEIFHFYGGHPVQMLLIHPTGAYDLIILGNDIASGQQPQVIVPAGTWQGTKLLTPEHWSLLGTTMAPAFEFKDLEIGNREDLINQYPNLVEFIRAYTH